MLARGNAAGTDAWPWACLPQAVCTTVNSMLGPQRMHIDDLIEWRRVEEILPFVGPLEIELMCGPSEHQRSLRGVWPRRVDGLALVAPMMTSCKGCRFIETLFDELQQFHGLKSLRLKVHQSFAVDAIEKLSQFVKTTKSLERLVMETAVQGEAGLLLNALEKNTSIEMLDLAGNYINSESATVLGNVLQTNSQLKSLYLADNYLHAPGGVALGQGLQVNQGLVYLDLCGNGIRDEGCIAICSALKQNVSLQKLVLFDNCITSVGGQAIAEMLGENKHLKQLSLAFNGLGHESTTRLFESLERNVSLEFLDLSNVYLDDALGFDRWVQPLASNTTLETLLLCGSQLGFNFVSCIFGQALRQNTQLQNLDISGNAFSSESIECMFENMKLDLSVKEIHLRQQGMLLHDIQAICNVVCMDTCVLEVLDIAGNNISEQGAVAFGEALKTNKHLRNLDLSNNPIKTQGLCAILTGINAGSCLRVLRLANADLVPSDSCLIARFLQTNSSLEQLDISGNEMTYTDEWKESGAWHSSLPYVWNLIPQKRFF
uniref:Uncharacterized protein n=1 Tax=Mucochytrium quahogii TaxID=96639 RepID=A0A7S2WBZ6_9STRA|mmetsp:Transcript_38134/g.61899  ORF Transcript_38134/g.61899 Transcript_38134/m.61899 type:complete len:545 (-) Transcript_38134:1627-3261(-)